MSAYLKLTLRTFTIWILTSLINGLLCGAYVSITIRNHEDFLFNTICSLFISLLFSAPGFFIFWIVLLLKVAAKTYGRALFRAALSTGFLLATATAIICSQFFNPEFPGNRYVWILLFAILSAMSGIMMHFNHFKKIIQ
jgi:hypothetical protein